MTFQIFAAIWILLIIICMFEAYFSVPQDKELNKYKNKKKK